MSARYLKIDALQEPYDLGVDELMRSKTQFNVSVEKDPSTGVTDFAEELVKILETAAVVVSTGAGKNVFVGSNASIPKGAGPFLSIVETSGTVPRKTHNQLGGTYLRPTALIVVRATSYVVARTMARAAYDALTVVVNQTVTP